MYLHFIYIYSKIVKSLIIYKVELFAAKYLDKINLIELYFDESLPEIMKGDIA